MALRSKAGEERASSHTRERPRLEPGALVDGRYQIVGALGEGGIGTVLVAEHVELRRRVALKVLQDPIGDDPTMRKRFEREARTLAAMQHPHIVAIIDYGIWSGMPYLVMELLEGRTLGDLLHEEGSLPQARALAIAHQMLRALGNAHSQGVIHRDLKPANVFLQALPDQQDHVKLLDFGFAKFFGSAVSSMVTGDGMVVGTPSYMAPEQATSGPLDQRVDVYAAGTVIFEMLAGRRPFEGQGLEVIRHRLVADPPALSAVRPDLGVSPELDEALSRALARKVEDRWPAIAELMAALARVPESAKVIVPIHSEPP
ncbi:MAG: serine/threonine protein kinase, partial [Sandaracinaceae bacterium]|nr:serine/threonine protein kinase [Sandaracinaceae bacterium]